LANHVKVRDSGADNAVSLADAWAVRNTTIVIDGNDNRVQSESDASIDDARITICGRGNQVLLGAGFRASGLIITITGDRNRITVGDGCTLLSTTMVCENDGNSITIAPPPRYTAEPNWPPSRAPTSPSERTAVFQEAYTSLQETVIPSPISTAAGSTHRRI
jgi:hypothetical protein